MKDAVSENMRVTDLIERRAISQQIIDEVLMYLHSVFGEVNPKAANMKKVSGLLGIIYPELFKYSQTGAGDTPLIGGWGLGGVQGVKNLHLTLCQRYFDKYLRQKRIVQEGLEVTEEKGKKRVTKKDIYGVNQRKWYVTASKESHEALKVAGCRGKRTAFFKKSRGASRAN